MKEAEEIRQLCLNAERGDFNAQYALGRLYAIGEGVTENMAETWEWFRIAIEQGN